MNNIFRTHNDKKRKFNHVEIGQEIFDDNPGQENSVITQAINHLNKNSCWKCINPNYFVEIKDCDNCKKISVMITK